MRVRVCEVEQFAAVLHTLKLALRVAQRLAENGLPFRECYVSNPVWDRTLAHGSVTRLGIGFDSRRRFVELTSCMTQRLHAVDNVALDLIANGLDVAADAELQDSSMVSE